MADIRWLDRRSAAVLLAVAGLAWCEPAPADFLADLAQCGKIQDPAASDACFADVTAGKPLGTVPVAPDKPQKPAKTQAIAQAISDDQVKQSIIQESIASYPGNCPCPYNSASNGSRCGKRSAWSRAGGYSPVCYENEVTTDMIARWRQAHGG